MSPAFLALFVQREESTEHAARKKVVTSAILGHWKFVVISRGFHGFGNSLEILLEILFPVEFLLVHGFLEKTSAGNSCSEL